jgi:hypothetical protein
MRRAVDKFTLRASKLVSSSPIRHPRGVGTGFEAPLQCHSIAHAHAARTGGRVVHGFLVERVREFGQCRLVSFVHHSVVGTAAGELVDPNFVPGAAPPLLEDPARGYDYELKTSWNTITVSNRPFRCPVTGTRMPAWTPLWTARVGALLTFSTDPRHARRRHFRALEEAGIHVAGLGLDPSNGVDLSFATNAEVVRVEMPEGEEPPEHLKDYRLADLVVPEAVRPLDASAVMSEEEEARLRR